jgi:hypothetical protein
MGLQAAIFRLWIASVLASTATPWRSPLQGPHRFDRIGCRIADPAGDRLVVEALYVLEVEFASRDVDTDLLDHAVMLDPASAIQRSSAGFGIYRRRISRAPHLRQALFRMGCNSALGSCFEVSAMKWD